MKQGSSTEENRNAWRQRMDISDVFYISRHILAK